MPAAVAIWVWFCAYLNGAGWTLSALHQLNAAGYAVALAMWCAGVLFWKFRARKPKRKVFSLRARLFHRFRKPFPLTFLILSAMAFIGGAIYAPSDYDALTYRLPRMLNWLAAGHWFWIPTANERMNYSTTAWEWIAMPLFDIFHSDRALFLIDAIGFLLMPGLLFSVFRRLGVARNVAWTWMWLLPLAYGYVIQAGGIENDLIGATFLLASIFFGLRARRSGEVGDIWLAGLSAALMTNAKLSNLPLLLPCLIAVWPALAQLRKRWFATLAVAGVAVMASAGPTIALNQIHTGSWTGDPDNSTGVQLKSPGAALLGNSLLLLQQSFMPPVLPDAHKITDRLNKKMPASWQQILKEKFPRYYMAGLNELPQEEAAGLGLGVTLLLLGGSVATFFGAGKKIAPGNIFSQMSLVAFAAWIAALVYMAKMGSEAAARLMLPYYPLAIVPLLLLPSQNFLLRFRTWRIFAALAALSVLPAIILSPARPLLPMTHLSGQFAQRHPSSALAQRLASVYSAYAQRNDALAPLREHLPDNAKEIGFVAGSDDTDYSLWRPFGKRQVVYLQNEIKNSAPIPDNIEWIVVKRRSWPELSNLTLENWAAQHHAQIVLSVPIVTIIAWGPETWCLLRIQR